MMHVITYLRVDCKQTENSLWELVAEIHGAGNVGKSFVVHIICLMDGRLQRQRRLIMHYVVLIQMNFAQEVIIVIVKKDANYIRMRRSLLITCAILILGCIVISKYLMSSREGFSNVNGKCGNNLPPCPAGTRCANGYCITDAPPPQRTTSEVSLLP
jgi:hypothetical protein